MTKNKKYLCLRSELIFCIPDPVKSLSTSFALVQICSANSRIVSRGTFRHCWAVHVEYFVEGPSHSIPEPWGLKYKTFIISFKNKIFMKKLTGDYCTPSPIPLFQYSPTWVDPPLRTGSQKHSHWRISTYSIRRLFSRHAPRFAEQTCRRRSKLNLSLRIDPLYTTGKRKAIETSLC